MSPSRLAVWSIMFMFWAAQAPPDALAGPPPSTATVTVGSDNACDYSDINDATFNGPDVTTLTMHVAKNISISTFQLLPSTRSVRVYGGYDNCSDGIPSGYTTLDGSNFSSGAVVLYLASTEGPPSHSVILRDIEIIHGSGSGTGGGAMRLSGDASVSLEHVYIHDNDSYGDGAGIWIDSPAGGPTLNLNVRDNSIISKNTSGSDGGGISCQGDAVVSVEDSQIGFNNADARGGGIFADGCTVELHSHGFLQGVTNNHVWDVDGKGGGVYVTDGTLRLSGLDGMTAVYNNRADYGGGIYADQSDVSILGNAWIIQNRALKAGGGIYVLDSTTKIQRLLDSTVCSYECTSISDNYASGSNGAGGGLYIFGGSTTLAGVHVSDNSTASSEGAAIFAQASANSNALGPQLSVYGSMIEGNTKPVTQSNTGSVVKLVDMYAMFGFTTFVNNTDSNGGLSFAVTVHNDAVATTGRPLEIYGSIFYQSGNLDADPLGNGYFPDGDCNRLSEYSSHLAQNSTRSTHLPPGFVDWHAGNYRLEPDSHMIDFCDSANGDSANQYTADGLSRPWDDPDTINNFGAYDLGALEYNGPLDRIFADAFESP